MLTFIFYSAVNGVIRDVSAQMILYDNTLPIIRERQNRNLCVSIISGLRIFLLTGYFFLSCILLISREV